MSVSNPSRRPLVRKGLTLIELIVVLTILIALGSLLIPILGNGLTRSHVGTCATNIPEITKMLQIRGATNGNFGDGWSTGVADATTTAGADTSVNGNDTVALTADEVAALQSAGISNVFNHGPDTAAGYNVTFSPGLVSETLAAGSLVITLTDADAEFLPTLGAGQRYIWLGIDREWSLLGSVAPEPPVHFGDTEGAFPQDVYSRFGAIFLLEEEDAGAAVNGDASVTFVRCSYSLDGDVFESADAHVGIYWDEVFDEEF